MKAHRFGKDFSKAFSLVELLVVVGMLALLSCLLVPALARAKPKSITAQCLSNKRQIQFAATMYATDNNDYLVPNSPAGSAGLNGWISAGMPIEDWNFSTANTNASPYQTSVFAPWLNNDIRAYRCPGDTIPSLNGLRIRSISMNGQVGGVYGPINYNPGYRLYSKVVDVGTPSAIWMFCDENFFTLDDGFFQVALSTPQLPSAPAAYHDGGDCFSFIDGHVSFQRWIGAPGLPLAYGGGVLSVPYQFGVKPGNGTRVGPSGGDRDWLWLRLHSTEAD